MYWYRAYGQLLASEIALPELRPAQPGNPAWTIRWGGILARGVATTGVAVGKQLLYEEFNATLWDTPTGFRVVVDDTGEFQLSPDGRELTAWRYEEGFDDFLRAHLLGRVIATSMHFHGMLVLHGSAVSYPRGAVAFLAPKGTGKSTMALNLTLSGGKLLSDDALPVMVAEQPLVWPGIHSIRLTGESAVRLAGELPSEQRPDGKFVLTDLAESQLEEQACSLQAIYLLGAARSLADNAAVTRRLIPPPLAAAALVGQSKIPEMLGPAQGPELLRRAAQVASRVPIYQLPVVRDLDRLHEVAAQIRAWHADAP